MNRKLKNIYIAFSGKLVGSKFMKNKVCETLALMPDEIIDFVTTSCWFVSSFEDAYAFTFTGNELKNQHLIFLSDELLEQDNFQIHYSIAHEIGHVILKHKNSVFVKQTKQEIEIQEKEADSFAKKYTKFV